VAKEIKTKNKPKNKKDLLFLIGKKEYLGK